MLKCTIFGLFAILCNALFPAVLENQEITSGQRLLVGYLDEDNSSPLPTYRLMTLDLTGNEVVFSESIIEGRDTYISMDHAKISARDTEGNLLVLNHLGEVIFQYDFPVSNRDNAWIEWYVWGWIDTETLVLSRVFNNQWLFYTLNTLDNTNEPQLFDRLNSSPIIQYMQDVYEIERAFESGINSIGISSIIRFSPNFEMLLTPPFVIGQPLDPFSSEHADHIFIWDLTLHLENPIAIVTNGFPWWYNMTFSVPAWSLDGESLLFAGFDIDSNIVLYRYEDFDVSPEIISQIVCSDSICDPRQISWSPTHQEVAYYWSTPIGDRSESRQLIKVDLLSGQQDVLLQTKQWVTSIFWNSNGTYIGFQEQLFPEDSTLVYLFNVETQTVSNLLETSNDITIFGWIDAPA